MAENQYEKSDLRRRMRERMADMSLYQRRRESAQVCRLISQHDAYRRAHVIMTYLALPSELNVDCLMELAWQHGKQVVAPRIATHRKDIEIIDISDLQDGVRIGPHHIREPVGDEVCPIESVSLVIVPGMAFDFRGNRLGRGGGYYDRFLFRLSGQTVSCGVGFRSQAIDAVVHEDHDVRLGALVTRDGWRCCC